MSGWTPYMAAIWNAGVEVGMPTRHRLQAPVAPLEEVPEERHAALGQRLLQHRAREPVDLHDQEPAAAARGRRPEPETADQTVEPVLDREDQIVHAFIVPGAARSDPASAV